MNKVISMRRFMSKPNARLRPGEHYIELDPTHPDEPFPEQLTLAKLNDLLDVVRRRSYPNSSHELVIKLSVDPEHTYPVLTVVVEH